MKHAFLALATVAGTLLVAGCNDRGDEVIPPTPLAENVPDSFLQYVNAQSPLAAGVYEVVVATNAVGQSGDYALVVTHDDGTEERFDGAWTVSGGADPDGAGNPRHAITLDVAGGVTVALASSVDAYIYLVRDGRVVAEADDGGTGGNPLISLLPSAISSAAYAEAYYNAVDPEGERATLRDFLLRNCFVAGDPACDVEEVGYDAHVVFRDSKDLGYGRNMYARRNTRGTLSTTDDTLAFFVGNYVVKLQPGDPGNYGPLNVEPAIEQDAKYHIGTNAIEFSPLDPADPLSEKITRFFTYNPAGDRITSADLDGRGVKHMPGMCWTCHGGRTLPLAADGSFPALALRSAKLNQLEVDSFDFSTREGYTRAAQEGGLREINRLVYASYEAMQSRPATEAGKWYADFAMDIAAARYGGPTFPEATYQEDAVPAGWQQTPSRPEGVERLYKQVVEPHCVACHALQGTSAGQSSSALGNAVNFSSWEKFISYRTTIIDYVFRRGVMPLSLRNFEHFWREPQQGPALLASFLNDPTLFDTAGQVLQPGLPVARPGGARVMPSPARLDGSASPFAQAWDWDIVDAPLGATVSFDDDSAARPVLTADTDGDYVISLRVANARGVSEAVEFTLTIDNAAATPSSLTFVDDILPLLENPVSSAMACTDCHRAPGGTAGIPVSYNAADNPAVYRDVLARVDFAEPWNSALLTKPTGLRHGGEVRIDTTTVEGRTAYNRILNWIGAGAPCGNAPLPALCQ